MDVLVKSPLRNKVITKMSDTRIIFDSSWEFIVEMGKRLETNFGYMFDWETGETYPQDDPRRR
jgi:hypothetical protein